MSSNNYNYAKQFEIKERIEREGYFVLKIKMDSFEIFSHKNCFEKSNPGILKLSI